MRKHYSLAHLGHGAHAHAQVPGRGVGQQVKEALGAAPHLPRGEGEGVLALASRVSKRVSNPAWRCGTGPKAMRPALGRAAGQLALQAARGWLDAARGGAAATHALRGEV